MSESNSARELVSSILVLSGPNKEQLLDASIDAGIALIRWQEAGKPRAPGKKEDPLEARRNAALAVLRNMTSSAQFEDILDHLRGVSKSDLVSAKKEGHNVAEATA